MTLAHAPKSLSLAAKIRQEVDKEADKREIAESNARAKERMLALASMPAVGKSRLKAHLGQRASTNAKRDRRAKFARASRQRNRK